MTILSTIILHQLESRCLAGHFGLEKENIRIDQNGNYALSPHPCSFGSRDQHPFITSDFAESQLELITPICETTQEARSFMIMLHHLVSLELKDEYLWPYSQPPALPTNLDCIQVAQFNHQEARLYREYLSEKYGKYHQLLSGLHFNFSFTQEFLQALHQAINPKQNYQHFCDQIYLKLARFYLKYAWLVSYLFGSGNVVHNSYMHHLSPRPMERLAHDAKYLPGGSSRRNGENGYINSPQITVSYHSLDDYLHDLSHAITTNQLKHAREYYSGVRLKSREKRQELSDLRQHGIHYLEIRSLDLDPSETEGVAQDTLDFLHLLFILGLCSEEDLSLQGYQEACDNQIQIADQNTSSTTLLRCDGKTKEVQAWGLELIQQMQTLNQALQGNWDDMLQRTQQKLNHPKQRLAEQIHSAVKKQGYQAYFLNLAQASAKKSHDLTYQLYGFEDLELSTQILLREAIKQGIEFEFLDRSENFIEFRHQQMVKQATKTALDSYTCVLAMENKVVTKKLVAKQGLVVPTGLDFVKPGEAFKTYAKFAEHAIVIKPKNTNFGTGISILKPPYTAETFERAIELAFYHDQSILIEQFFPGREFRFLVIAGKTVAVLHREPANVIGDGQHSIEELIAIKNQDPRRGIGYKKPLEQIQADDIVHHYLAQQHLSLQSVLAPEQKIFLRENSNVSTGGDSIDFSQIMPNSYKELAVLAAASVDASICGVDMIIKDLAAKNIEDNYCILELNFNPAIQMHTYPYQGQDQKVAIHILRALKLIEEI